MCFFEIKLRYFEESHDVLKKVVKHFPFRYGLSEGVFL